MRKIIILSLLLVSANCSFAAQNFTYQQNNVAPSFSSNLYNENFKIDNTTLKGRVVTVPAGVNFKAVVTTPVCSETAVVGQPLTLVLGSDFYYNGNKIAPAGSSVNGSVIEASRAKHGSMNGKLMLRFTQIITTTGLNIPISAVVKTDDNTGTLIGGTNVDVAVDYAKDVAVGAGAGALAGVIISPLAGGSIGKGTALSTAVGAGGGLVKSIWDKGSDVALPTNAVIDLVLTQPITVNPTASEDKSFGQ